MFEFFTTIISLSNSDRFKDAFKKYPLKSEVVSYLPGLSLTLLLAFLFSQYPSEINKKITTNCLQTIFWIFVSIWFAISLWFEVNVVIARKKVHEIKENIKGYTDLLQRKLNMKNALILLTDSLVKEKSMRFFQYLRRYQPSDDVFKKITQPEKQIDLALQKIYLYFFNSLPERFFDDKTTEHEIKKNVSILEPEDDYLKFTKSFNPVKSKDIPENMDKFRYSCSAAGNAWSSQDIVIISDISDELETAENSVCAELRDADENIGSLVCYPVFIDESKAKDKLLFIINLYCSKPNYFGSQFKEDEIRFILTSLTERLKMEYALFLLKKTQETTTTIQGVSS